MKQRFIYSLLCGISVFAAGHTSLNASATLPMPAGVPAVTSSTTHAIFAGAKPLQLGASDHSRVWLSSSQTPVDVPADVEPVGAATNSIQYVLATLHVDTAGANGRYPITDTTILSSINVVNGLLNNSTTPDQLSYSQLRNFFVSYSAMLRLECDPVAGTALVVEPLPENVYVRLITTDNDKQFVGHSLRALSFNDIKAAYNIIDHYMKLAQGLVFPSNPTEANFAKEALTAKLHASSKKINVVKYKHERVQYRLLVLNERTGLYEFPEQTVAEIVGFNNYLLSLDSFNPTTMPASTLPESDAPVIVTAATDSIDRAIQFDYMIKASMRQPAKYVFVRAVNLASLKNTLNDPHHSAASFCGVDNGKPYLLLNGQKVYVAPQAITALSMMSNLKDPKRPGSKVTPQEKGLAMALTQGVGTTEDAYRRALLAKFSHERTEALLKFIIEMDDIEEESDEE